MFKWLIFCLALPLPAVALEGKVLRSDKDVVVPSRLPVEIENLYIARVRDEDPKDIRTDLQLKMEIPRQMLSFNVILKKVGGGSLDEDVVFKVPAGGGQIDLEPYVHEGKGLFALKFQMDEGFEDEDLDELKVYYIPRYHRQIQGSETRGLSCDTYAEITRYFKSEILKDGVLLTTTENAYFPVIAGSYILVVTHPTGIKVASLTLWDSRFKNFLCPTKGPR